MATDGQQVEGPEDGNNIPVLLSSWDELPEAPEAARLSRKEADHITASEFQFCLLLHP